jgi:long-chain fatty acid transport protein
LKQIITFYLITLFSFSALAGGFQINEHGARPLGMGGAFTAIASDASAVYWNGAGLTSLYGTNITLGTALIIPSSTFRGVTPDVNEYKMVNQVFYPSHLFASHRIASDWAVGFGFTSPFGLGTKWDEDWVGRYLAVETELQIFTLSPVIAYRIFDQLSISAAFVYSFANVLITRQTSQAPFSGDAFVELEGDDMSAFGYNLGLLYKPSSEFSLGVSFHSQVNYNFEGEATTTGSPQLATNFPNGDITAELTTPINLAVGAAYRVMPELLLSAEFQYVGWSSYDQLAIEFYDPKFNSASPRDYKNSWIARLGGEYKFSSDFALQGGIYFDKNPVKPERLNPTLPESDRLGLSLGASYKFTPAFGIQLAYLFIRAQQITVDNSLENYTRGIAPFNGTYNSTANIASLIFSYSF